MSLEPGKTGSIHSVNPQPRIVRAMVVDRDTMTSQLLADVLARDLKYQASGVTGASLLQTLTDGDVDVVVISADLQAGVGKGFLLAQAVLRSFPSILIVMLLDRSSRGSVISAFRAGARGVFTRHQSMSEFSECVEQVRRGFLWAGSAEVDFLLEALRSIPAPEVSFGNIGSTLTTRELQVVHLAAQGKTNKAIARELGLSEHTVKNYLFHVFDKLGVSNRIELLFYLTTKGVDLRSKHGPKEKSGYSA